MRGGISCPVADPADTGRSSRAGMSSAAEFPADRYAVGDAVGVDRSAWVAPDFGGREVELSCRRPPLTRCV